MTTWASRTLSEHGFVWDHRIHMRSLLSFSTHLSFSTPLPSPACPEGVPASFKRESTPHVLLSGPEAALAQSEGASHDILRIQGRLHETVAGAVFQPEDVPHLMHRHIDPCASRQTGYRDDRTSSSSTSEYLARAGKVELALCNPDGRMRSGFSQKPAQHF